MLTNALVFSALSLAAPQATPQYRCVVLESAGGSSNEVLDVNVRGESVGYVVTAAGQPTAMYWDQTGESTVLGRAQSLIASRALAINANGLVVGYGGLTAQPLPLLWTLGAGGHPVPGPKPARAVDVNAGGDILLGIPAGPSPWVGQILKSDGTTARIETAGTQVDVTGISDDRRVSGAWLGTNVVPFRWSEVSGFEYLPVPAGFQSTWAEAISSTGSHVVGWGLSGSQMRALAWDESGIVQVLPSSTLQESKSDPAAVNAAGWVVGLRYGTLPGGSVPRNYGTLWANGVAYELEGLIQAGPSAEVRTATGINDRGQIVGTGRINGLPVLLRLDPL
jgi:uncharacterized membrane protein